MVGGCSWFADYGDRRKSRLSLDDLSQNCLFQSSQKRHVLKLERPGKTCVKGEKEEFDTSVRSETSLWKDQQTSFDWNGKMALKLSVLHTVGGKDLPNAEACSEGFFLPTRSILFLQGYSRAVPWSLE